MTVVMREMPTAVPKFELPPLPALREAAVFGRDGHTIKSVLESLADKREELDGELGKLKAPTLIVWGEDDAITPLAMAHAFQRGIAGSRLHVIARCGHLPPIEQPDAFAAAVTGFLGC